MKCSLLARVMLAVLVAGVCWMVESPRLADAAPRIQDASEQDDEVEPALDVSFETKDHVLLVATYFAGPPSKETPAVILIHDWDSDRGRMYEFAKYLQKDLKCSVLVPDLRGHGKSVRTSDTDKKIDRSRFKKADVASAIKDLEQCKRFLMKKNNKGELNIEMLTMIAVGKTGVQAVKWCVDDWGWAPTVGGLKQGQDVKLLCLISPSEKIKGVSMKPFLKTPLMTGKGMPPLPLQIVWAQKNSTSLAQSKEIYDVIAKPRKRNDDAALTMTKLAKSRDSATGLVTSPDIREVVFAKVADTIRKTIIDKSELLAWQNRKK